MTLNKPHEKEDYFKTAYQRAHYYQNVEGFRRIDEPKDKVREDLYIYDPIINEKTSTYRKSYGEKRLNDKALDYHGKFEMTKIHFRYTLKDLFDDFKCNPIEPITYNKTTSGSQYKDPSEKVETRLYEKFCEESPSNEINRALNETAGYPDFIDNYQTTTNYDYPDKCDERTKGIGQDDVITCYNHKEKNKVPPKIEEFKVFPKSPMTVPFFGDVSTYKDDFKNPDKQSAFLGEVCLHPEYFESVKQKISQIPGMYSTEQKVTGSGEPVRKIV